MLQTVARGFSPDRQTGFVVLTIRICRDIFRTCGGELKWFLGLDVTAPDDAGISGDGPDHLTIAGDPLVPFLHLHAVGIGDRDLEPANGVPDRLAPREHE